MKNKNIEIVVFNDKSWVRLTEYQKLQEDFEQFKKGKVCDLCNYNTVGQDEYIDALEEQIKELKAQIEKMKCCVNCKHFVDVEIVCQKGLYLGNRDFTECYDWELAE